ncbi:PiggyBac transposable element-derived protein 1 [Eumeta japonica]|uniref:PiggyBac transposable element-derived protein 1 n=1 Tax=Eumeta variegata TaxID=151549 RepID=A0A4C1WPS9_EUMVA|nr:PiggyBac transposable element-derived protein 1 [Eumeta japonica]
MLNPPTLPDYAPPAFSSSPDAEAAARSGVLAPTRCERPASLFIEAGSDSESADPLPDELHNSESEEELSDRESSGNNNAFYLGKDNSTKWSKEPPRQSLRTRRFNLVTQLPGPKRVTSSEKEPLGIWRHFFDDTIIEIIVKYTNQSIANVKDNFSRETYAKQTDHNEIRCLIDLLLLAGVQKSNHLNIEELFRTDGGSVEIFRLSMSAQRFKFLLRTLRFDDCSTREQRKALDKICHIREIFEKFVQNCRNVTTDIWYSSIPLAEALLQKGLTTVGTIRKDKKEISSDFNTLRGRSVKSNMFGFRNDMVLVSHVLKAKKNVLLISTMHNDAKVDVETQKPDLILSYNETKGGVDVVDRLCANYNCARATKRWPMVIFYAMLNAKAMIFQRAVNDIPQAHTHPPLSTYERGPCRIHPARRHPRDAH